LLINLQPYATPMQVEVLAGTALRTIGTAQDSSEKRASMRASLQRVAEAVGAGLFSLREETTWQFRMEYTSAEDWKEFAERPTCGGINADMRRLDEALARPDGRVLLTEDDLAAVYVRLEAT
jgi:hypothetical protein